MAKRNPQKRSNYRHEGVGAKHRHREDFEKKYMQRREVGAKDRHREDFEKKYMQRREVFLHLSKDELGDNIAGS